MITRTATPEAIRPTPHWQRLLTEGVGRLGELLDLLQLSAEEVGASTDAARDFPLRVPRGFVDRMGRGDPRDPLLLQVLPTQNETEAVPGFEVDPLAEREHSPAPGVLHKYQGRALLVLTGACAVHCRYCFRRHFPYSEHQEPRWQGAVQWLAEQPDVDEILLSGGDPLALADSKLAELVAELDDIPHLRRLRLHTRLPIVLPERVDTGLLGWLEKSRLQKVMVVHANHPQEIDDSVRKAFQRLRNHGVTLFNQAVLLRGINDRVAILKELNKTLFEAGVLPYYLHLMDRVRGAAHFEVADSKARELVWQLMQELPGYLIPRLVREIPGAPSKVPINPFPGTF